MANDRTSTTFAPPVWAGPDGAPLTCRDKIKLLNENLKEIRDMAQDALEDAILMGADESQAREALRALVASLVNPYPGTGKS
mgnify:CR=1 FL=1